MQGKKPSLAGGLFWNRNDAMWNNYEKCCLDLKINNLHLFFRHFKPNWLSWYCGKNNLSWLTQLVWNLTLNHSVIWKNLAYFLSVKRINWLHCIVSGIRPPSRRKCLLLRSRLSTDFITATQESCEWWWGPNNKWTILTSQCRVVLQRWNHDVLGKGSDLDWRLELTKLYPVY